MADTDLARAYLVVEGRVQGVFFRQSTRDLAVALGLSGWVRNENDGTVAIEAIGPRNTVQKLIAWCHQGPPSARVEQVKVEWYDCDEEHPGPFRII